VTPPNDCKCTVYAEHGGVSVRRVQSESDGTYSSAGSIVSSTYMTVEEIYLDCVKLAPRPLARPGRPLHMVDATRCPCSHSAAAWLPLAIAFAIDILMQMDQDGRASRRSGHVIGQSRSLLDLIE